jgi:two-component system, OmpR family, sensor kinase
LTLGFAAAMAVLLTAAGVLVTGGIDRQLDRLIESDLRVRARDVAALVEEGQRVSGRVQLDGGAGRLVQVLDLHDHVVASTSDQAGRSLLTAREVATAARHEMVVQRTLVGPDMLLLARSAGPSRVVVVGASLETPAQARESLVRVLLVTGPVLLLLAVLAGYGVAHFALRPMEAMRRRAAVLSVADTGDRLPVPRAHDEVAALGRTLNGMIDRLESALEREQTLIADASHELRTPLAIAQAEVELALRPDATPEALHEALDSIGEEIQRLVRLCDDLLVLARADRRELRLERRQVAVAELLRGVGDRVRLMHPSGAVVIVPPNRRADAELDADAFRIEQALSNLVANSFRYGAGRVRIWAAAEPGAMIHLHVTDDGPGFDQDFLPRAFDRFARGVDTPRGAGSGLGLAIVAAIAHAHGGEAGARNLAARGADVWIALPRG